MAFAADGLGSLLLVTARDTQKYANMQAQPGVALLIDDREDHADDLQGTTAVTVVGEAYEVPADERPAAAALLLRRHPYLQALIERPDSAVMRVRVESYQVVRGIDEVWVWRRGDESGR